MKKVIFYAAIAVLFPFSTSSFADSLKVGFVDAQKVFETSDEGKRAQSKVEEYVSSRQKIIDIEEKELRQLEEDLRRQASLLSPEATKMQQEEIQKKFVGYQKKARELNKEVQEKKVEVNRIFFKMLEVAIKKTAEKEGYHFVLDRNKEGGPVLYSKESFDITDKVIAQVNEMSKK